MRFNASKSGPRYQHECVNVTLNGPEIPFGLEACNLTKSQITSLDFVLNRFFMKLFGTKTLKSLLNVKRISPSNCQAPYWLIE